MKNNTTIAKVYGAIAGIPLAAILLAGAISGGGSHPGYDGAELDLDSVAAEHGSGSATGGRLNEAEAYAGLGKYNPCIFIACEGE